MKILAGTPKTASWKTRKARRKQSVKNTLKVREKPRRALTNGRPKGSASSGALGKEKGPKNPT